MPIKDERNGETINEPPAFAHTFRHMYQLFFKRRIVTRPLRVRCFSNISQESCQRFARSIRRWVQKDQRSGRTQPRVRRAGRHCLPIRLRSRYVSGRTRDWLKMKNRDAPVVKREAEEDWSR